MDLANRLAAMLAANLGYDEERQAVIAYGLGAAIQMLELMIIALIFGVVFDCLIETMILFWGVGLMRRATGGAHCQTYMGCILTSSLSFCLIGFLCRYYIPGWPAPGWHVLLGIIPAFACFAWIAWKRVPKASANKPIDNPQKRARLRRQCLITALIYLAAAILLLLLQWNDKRNVSAFWSLIIVIWWQSFMLTNCAERFTRFMDRLFLNKSE